MDSVLGGSGHHLAGLVNTQHGLVPLDEPISNHGLLNHGLGHGMGGDLDIHSHPEVVGHHMEDMVGGYVGHPESQVPGRARARKPSQKQAAIYGGAPAGRKLDPPEPQVARSRRANAGNRLSELLKEQNKSIQESTSATQGYCRVFDDMLCQTFELPLGTLTQLFAANATSHPAV